MGHEKIIPERLLGSFSALLARSANRTISRNIYNFNLESAKVERKSYQLSNNGAGQPLVEKISRDSLNVSAAEPVWIPWSDLSQKRRFSTTKVPFLDPIVSDWLSPGLDYRKHSSLPFSSTLCGICTDVCRMKSIFRSSYTLWRQEITKRSAQSKELSTEAWKWGIFKSLISYKLLRQNHANGLKNPNSLIFYNPLNVWGKASVI